MAQDDTKLIRLRAELSAIVDDCLDGNVQVCCCPSYFNKQESAMTSQWLSQTLLAHSCQWAVECWRKCVAHVRIDDSRESTPTVLPHQKNLRNSGDVDMRPSKKSTSLQKEDPCKTASSDAAWAHSFARRHQCSNPYFLDLSLVTLHTACFCSLALNAPMSASSLPPSECLRQHLTLQTQLIGCWLHLDSTGMASASPVTMLWTQFLHISVTLNTNSHHHHAPSWKKLVQDRLVNSRNCFAAMNRLRPSLRA